MHPTRWALPWVPAFAGMSGAMNWRRWAWLLEPRLRGERVNGVHASGAGAWAASAALRSGWLPERDWACGAAIMGLSLKCVWAPHFRWGGGLNTLGGQEEGTRTSGSRLGA